MARIAPSPSAARAAIAPPPLATARPAEWVFTDPEAKEKPTVLPGGVLPSLSPLPPAPLSAVSLAAFPGTSLVRSSMKKEMQFTIGASYQLATTTSGYGPNTVISNDMLSGLSDFTSLASLFDEYFVKSFKCVYQPASRYQKPLEVADNYVDFPLHVVSIQHSAPNYSTHTDATSNAALLVCNTADPWSYTWKNNESKRSGVLADPSTTSVSQTQGWCLTRPDNSSSYTGSVQIIAPTGIPAASASNVVGTVSVRWELAFRSRK